MPTVFLIVSLPVLGCGGPPPVPGPAPSPTPAPAPAPAPAVDRSAELLKAHNAERSKRGLAPLTAQPQLQAMAQSWAAGMARSGVMSHAGFSARLHASGYPAAAAGENVATGQRDVAEVMQSWVHSPGHYANIVGPYTEAGFGVASGPGRLCC